MASTDENLDPKTIVGKGITFWVDYEDGSPRYFHGIVRRFSYMGTDDRFSRYHAEVVPAFWFLTQTSDCKVFQNQTVPKIIEKVFADHSDLKFEMKVSGKHAEWEYCVQYRETDFNFVSRLMEQEGIFYYFKHEKGKHTLVLTDKTDGYYQLRDKDAHLAGGPEKGHDNITSWEHQYEFHSGKWAHTDYNFEEPDTSLLTKTDTTVQIEGVKKYEVYDYPAEIESKGDSTDDLTLRIEQEEAGHEVVHGSGICRSFSPAGKFKLTAHRAQAEQNKGYVVTSVQHSATISDYVGAGSPGVIYSNSFTAIPEKVVFRPTRLTPKPVIQGVQTAVVVGPDGEEIHTDKYGRVKVQFHWDRYGEKNEKSSCFIRVAQFWAGKRWGASFWPRIGQEVVVSFLEGDPDRPLIVGSVYNANQMPPYQGDGPDPKHANDNKVSGIKSNSTKGGVGFNEIRFDDNKDKEQVFIHAERNMDVRVKNNCMERVIGDRNMIVGCEGQNGKSGDLKEMIYQDAHLNVKRDQFEHIEGSIELLVGRGQAAGGGYYDLWIEKDKCERIDGQSDLHVIGARNEKIDGGQSLTVIGDQQEKVTLKHALEAGTEIHLKAGMKVIIEANLQLTLKAGASFIDIGPAGIAISGAPVVLINSGGAAGAGTGSNPTTPLDAVEAHPAEPAMADDAKSGQKSSG
jgi:type VI secretion system secreted protein VgrG